MIISPGLSFLLIAFSLPALAIFASKGTVALFAACALFILGQAIYRRKFSPVSPVLGMTLAAFLSVSCLSALWAVNAQETLVRAAQLAGIGFAALLVLAQAQKIEPDEARRIGAALLLGLVCAIVFLVFESVSQAWLTRFFHGLLDAPPEQVRDRIDFNAFLKNGCVTLALLAPIGLHILQKRFGVRFAFAGFCAALAVLLMVPIPSGAAICALFAGSALMVLAKWRLRLMAKSLAVIFAIAIASLPFGIAHSPPPQNYLHVEPRLADHMVPRLVIWRFTGGKILERPILGWGLDSARSLPGAEDLVPVTLTLSDGNTYNMGQLPSLPLHPHNLILQVWLELGAIGALILCGFLFALIRNCQRDGALGPVKLGTVGAVFVAANLAFGAWQSWWLATLALIAALLAAISRAARP